MRLYTALVFLSGLALGLLRDAPSASCTRARAASAGFAKDATLEEMLSDFAADFRRDPARSIVFGIEVRDAEPSRWHVYVGDREEGERECPVEVVPGFPPEPVPYFTTDLETLTAIHRGELASMTAMGKSFSTDFAPLDLETTPGFHSDEATAEQLVSLGFHFWTRGFPERIRFGDLSLTRPMHGANGVLFYYQKGFRSGYVHIRPGEHANEDTRSQTNPFSTLFLVTKGELKARIGDTECVLSSGEAVVIGPDVHPEFSVEDGAVETAEGVLLMFGDGA